MPPSDPNIFDKVNDARRGMKAEGEIEIADLDFTTLWEKDYQ